MFLFNKENVYRGYSVEELSKVRGTLEKEDIKHSYKVVNYSGQWSGWGTRRGKFGSYGINMDYEKQYAVYVHRKDVEKAKHLVNRALHQRNFETFTECNKQLAIRQNNNRIFILFKRD